MDIDFENCVVRKNVKMSGETSFKIGGEAALLLEPKSAAALCDVIKRFNKEGIRYRVFGNGTNLLVTDGKIENPIIKIGREMAKTEVCGNVIEAQAGALLPQIARAAQKASLTGLEFAQGIPGSVGGAVRMNAGAYGGEMKDVVTKVEFVTPEGEIREITADELCFSYRKSVFSEKGGIITKVYFSLKEGNADEIAERMRNLAERRREKQPLEYPSAGSAFKRPEGHFAAALIDEAGLKGKRIGGACVSEKHAGFVINEGGATARDVERLIEEIKRAVFEKSGVKLETEVEIWK